MYLPHNVHTKHLLQSEKPKVSEWRSKGFEIRCNGPSSCALSTRKSLSVYRNPVYLQRAELFGIIIERNTTITGLIL